MPKAESEAHDRRSLHERIAADLRDDIMSGELPPDANLPSTAQLRTRFGASNATVQKALQLLKDERLVVGRAGAAVTVREHRQRTIRPAASLAQASADETHPWLTEAAKHGTEARIALLDVTETSPPADIRTALGLSDEGTAVLRSQLLLIDEEPAELVKSYYPLHIADGTPLMERSRLRGGTPTLLRQLGHTPHHCVDRVSARVPTQEQFEALRLPGSLPVLCTLRVVYAADGGPIEATSMVKAGHLYELQYEFVPQ
ncbi:GntR family transcriptional regulator [Streptomyces sp. NPDC050546]|uniref:GntR family transcriptional regulator n=1 Tax=Streptomyces sp. NPDC050546 TaxID=3365628 RepID=UPI00378E6C9D